MESVRKKMIIGSCVLAMMLILAGCGGESGSSASGDSGRAPAPPSDELTAQETKVAQATGPAVVEPTIPPGEWMDIDTLYTQVAARYDQYQWPPAYQPDLEVLRSMSEAPPDSQFQAGYEHTILGSMNDCAWSLAWLDAYNTGDVGAMSVAVDQLQVSADSIQEPSTKEFRQQMVDTGRLQDPGIIQLYVNANCQDDYWIHGASVAPFFRLIR